MIAGGAGALGLALPSDHFEFDAEVLALGVRDGDVEIGSFEEPLHLGIDFFQQGVGFERGAERLADFVQHVQLFRAAPGVLHETAVVHGHAHLLAQGGQEAEFGGVELAAVRRGQQQHAGQFFLGLQADAHDGLHPLADRQPPEAREHFFAFERGPGGVAAEVAEDGQAAEAAGQLHEVVAQSVFLQSRAEGCADAGGHRELFAARARLAQQYGAGGEADDGQHAFESLGQHGFRFAALQAGSGQIQIGERQHVALDARALAFVGGQQHQRRRQQLRGAE